MSGINTRNGAENDSKKSSYFEKLGYALALASLLHISVPTQAQTNVPTNINNTEQVDGSVDKYNGIYIPAVYKSKLEEFFHTNKMMKDSGALMFTADFVLGEMENDRGIGKENQLLFVLHSIYKQITKNDLYDGQDGDTKISEAFKNVEDKVAFCGQRYRDNFKAYIKERTAKAQQKTADADKQIADADKQIADADKQIADADKQIADADKQIADAQQRSAESRQEAIKSISESLEGVVAFYNSYKRNINVVTQEDIDDAKKLTKNIIELCKEYDIDYKSILLKKLGNDEEKLYDLLEILDIPVIASNKGTYDIINHYNPVNTSPEVAKQWYELREINEVRERFKNRIALILANEIADNLSKLSNDNVA